MYIIIMCVTSQNAMRRATRANAWTLRGSVTASCNAAMGLMKPTAVMTLPSRQAVSFAIHDHNNKYMPNFPRCRLVYCRGRHRDLHLDLGPHHSGACPLQALEWEPRVQWAQGPHGPCPHLKHGSIFSPFRRFIQDTFPLLILLFGLIPSSPA